MQTKSLIFVPGMLLRWFIHLYDLEIVEEEAFMKWKEDLTDAYPGKGKALFQVSCLFQLWQCLRLFKIMRSKVA